VSRNRYRRPADARRGFVKLRHPPLVVHLLYPVSNEERDGSTARPPAIATVAIDHVGGLPTGPDPDSPAPTPTYRQALAHLPLPRDRI
jgi:hypothetical protein